jgi:hypothetical protein
MNLTNKQPNGRKLAIFYEHPEWFKPLFTELEGRGLPYERLLAYQHHYDPAERQSPYALVVNRMSPSAFTRGHAQAIPYTLEYLAYLKEIGANVLNGYEPYSYEFSKARQISLLHRLGVAYPRALVINDPEQAPAAAAKLNFPLLTKPNIGGSGAGIKRFDSMDDLKAAANSGKIDLGIDGIGLVQEYLPARGESIVRVEILGGRFLYAIRLYLQSENSFNLCPADYCDLPENQIDEGLADGVSGRGLLIEGYTPPLEVIQTVEQITRAAGIEVGGVEYLVNDLNGRVTYYDVNTLSNFVADAPNIIGFDPFPRLVDYIQARANGHSAAEIAAAPNVALAI